MALKTQRKREREVTNTISEPDVVRATFFRTKPVEVRQRPDGTWGIHYPDPGFNPCDCSKKCKSETLAGPNMIQSSFTADDLATALDEAREMGSIGEPKVIAMESHSERMQRIWAERRQARGE